MMRSSRWPSSSFTLACHDQPIRWCGGPVGTTVHRTTSDRRLAARPTQRSCAGRRQPIQGLRPFAEADAGDFFGRGAIAADLCEAVDRSVCSLPLWVPPGLARALSSTPDWFRFFASMAGELRDVDDTGRATAGCAPCRVRLSFRGVLSIRTRPEASMPRRRSTVRFRTGADHRSARRCLDAARRVRARPVPRHCHGVPTGTCRPADLRRGDVESRDMYDRPLQHPTIGSLIGAATLPITPMSAAELEDAVQLRTAGTRLVRGGVVSSIITETMSNPGESSAAAVHALPAVRTARRWPCHGCCLRRAQQCRRTIARRTNDLYERSSVEDRERVRLLFIGW